MIVFFFTQTPGPAEAGGFHFPPILYLIVERCESSGTNSLHRYRVNFPGTLPRTGGVLWFPDYTIPIFIIGMHNSFKAERTPGGVRPSIGQVFPPRPSGRGGFYEGMSSSSLRKNRMSTRRSIAAGSSSIRSASRFTDSGKSIFECSVSFSFIVFVVKG